ncbi:MULTISPECIES: phosphoribosylglycinamide formyltransferase [unclassified Lentimicrobium]|uniref:phosphoribosylglycinamide formyltransferase n=1 Tax=unclassified Lentimicrobium TaxID=2677434 RepID=UPI00155749C0|nr:MULTISPECIES: phosphoribosylglycinamide formyltransferase [unclassified Lentimicrobium]NPD47772.1 phosphoribosylglycinamide formyltransferase [Lentimicrobium sp. S6]NPD86655.1 phosphoribosylglycinamide formyltransferase [Lentimicrobium sp. L6]
MKRIAIFASGNGSNAENIIKFFLQSENISVELVLTNNANAKVIERAAKLDIPVVVFNRSDFYGDEIVLESLIEHKIDLVVLAGFMWLVPSYLIQNYPLNIINIHPALLPKYGGKGMYGDYVHQAVSEAREKESGITVHYVNEKYDDGDIIFQKSIEIEEGEDPDSIAQKIHTLEYEYFPKVIKDLLA